MLKLQQSKSGRPTLVYNNTFLHSRYDPEKEAVRFINESLKGENPSIVILLGAGLGYLADALCKALPFSKNIFIYYSESIFNLVSKKPELSWHPGMDITASDFIAKHFSDIDLEGLKIIEWTASSLLFPQISKKINLEINNLVKEFRGNIVTTNIFGKTWIRNSLLNFISIESVLEKPGIFKSNPVVITASGPTLENAVLHIKQFRNKINLWTLPSAVPFLIENDIRPDLIILTDSSYYSICHIKNIPDKEIPIIMPLSAVRGVYNISKYIYLISQPFFYEEIIFKKAGRTQFMIPPEGSVAATAMALAEKLTSNEIIFSGLDLCFSDIKSHVRTSFFSDFLMQDAGRISPFYSRVYSRAASQAPTRKSSIRTSIALDTYSGWFRSISKNFKGRLFRFLPSPNNVCGITNLNADSFEKLINKYTAIKRKKELNIDKQYPSKKTRIEIVQSILDEWNEIILNAEKSANTVNALLKNHLFLNLAYFIDLADLTELKKSYRAGSDGKNEIKDKLFSKLNRFLESLYNKIKKV
jgi:hypothetical protein